MAKDARGLTMTGAAAKAAGLYDRALENALAFRGDPVGLLDAALAEDPGFVMAHALKAHLFAFSLHPGLRGRAAAAIEAAHGLDAVPRERAHLAAAAAWLEGRYGQAQAVLEGLLQEHPYDIAAMLFAHQADFFGTDTGPLLERPTRLLDRWPEGLPGRGYLLGMRAFGLEEAGGYAEAEALGREAVALNPLDAWATHAVAHVLEMQGRDAEGIAWYRAREADWSSGYFAVHNWWHWALYHVDRGETADALAVYDRGLDPTGRSITLNLCDAASLLWRLWLVGNDTGGRFAVLAERFEKPAANPCHVFNDIHAVLAFAGAGRDDMVEAQVARLAVLAEGEGAYALMLRGFGLPAARACQALASGDAKKAVALLEPAMPSLALMTGSHAQRDVMRMTLIEAWLRAGERGKARAALEARLAAKPESGRIAADLARAG